MAEFLLFSCSAVLLSIVVNWLAPQRDRRRMDALEQIVLNGDVQILTGEFGVTVSARYGDGRVAYAGKDMREILDFAWEDMA